MENLNHSSKSTLIDIPACMSANCFQILGTYIYVHSVLILTFCRYTELIRQRCGVKGKMGKSDRKVPAQPNVFKGKDGKVSRYNMRKFAELPYHLIGSRRVQNLCDEVLFNYHWLHSKISAMPIDAILKDFIYALTIIDDPLLR